MKKSKFTQLRERANLTLEEAAEVIQVSLRSAYRYENGESCPSSLAISTLQLVAKNKIAASRKGKFRFIDLFAGIGGLRIGFEGIGGKCVFTSEWDKYAVETYKKNFPEDADHVFAGDIREFTKDDESLSNIPAHDVLLAGFPCQPFSIAGVSKKNSLGRPHGFLCDTQGTLFFDVAQIIKHHKPKAFMLENVKNLQRHDGGRTFSTIMNVLEKELGYTVKAHVVNSSPWVPQKRERIFIVGFLEDTDFSFDNLSRPQEPHPRLGDILAPHVDDKYTLSSKLWEYLQNYKKKHAAKGNGFGFGLVGKNDVTRTLSARYYKDGSEVLIDQGPQKCPRRLTPSECARLMGYEHGERKWKIPVSDTQAYKQFGNGVVVPVVEAVAKMMEPYLVQKRVAKVVSFPEENRIDHAVAVNG